LFYFTKFERQLQKWIRRIMGIIFAILAIGLLGFVV